MFWVAAGYTTPALSSQILKTINGSNKANTSTLE